MFSMRIAPILNISKSLFMGASCSDSSGLIGMIVSRNVMRCHFPRPNERKRIKRHSWKARMATPAGRRILMNRILKGCWVYSH